MHTLRTRTTDLVLTDKQNTAIAERGNENIPQKTASYGESGRIFMFFFW